MESNSKAIEGRASAPCSPSSAQEPEQQECGTTHYAGCDCHERGWENKWKAAVEAAAQAEVDRDIWKANHDNQVALKRALMDRPDIKERAALVEKLAAERDDAQRLNIAFHMHIRKLERERDEARAMARDMRNQLEKASPARLHFPWENATVEQPAPTNDNGI